MAALVHHKTGTFLAASVFRRLCGLKYRPDGDAEQGSLSNCPRFTLRYNGRFASTGVHTVHFMRNPFDMVISGYFYHREAAKPERWTLLPLHKPTAHRILRAVRQALFHIQTHPGLGVLSAAKNESFRDYLQRVPMRDGLYLSMLAAQKSDIQDMVQTHVRKSPTYMSTCMRDFTSSQESFLATWAAVANFTGFGGDSGVPWDFISRAISPHGPGAPMRPAKAAHVNTGATGMKEMARELVVHLDQEVNHGTLASAEMFIGCF